MTETRSVVRQNVTLILRWIFLVLFNKFRPGSKINTDHIHAICQVITLHCCFIPFGEN